MDCVHPAGQNDSTHFSTIFSKHKTISLPQLDAQTHSAAHVFVWIEEKPSKTAVTAATWNREGMQNSGCGVPAPNHSWGLLYLSGFWVSEPEGWVLVGYWLCWSLGVTVGLSSAGPYGFYQTPFFPVSFQEVLFCCCSNTRIWLVRMGMEFLSSSFLIEQYPFVNWSPVKTLLMQNPAKWLLFDCGSHCNSFNHFSHRS